MLVNILKTYKIVKDIESKNALMLQCLLIWVVKILALWLIQATDRNSELVKGANLLSTSQGELVLRQQWVGISVVCPKAPQICCQAHFSPPQRLPRFASAAKASSGQR